MHQVDLSLDQCLTIVPDCFSSGEAVPGLTGMVGTTSMRVTWGELSFAAQTQLQSFQLEIRREGRTELVVEETLSFFSRSFTTNDLAPGIPYEVRLVGTYAGGVTGLPSIANITTLEEGESTCMWIGVI